jgi:hypothetical protein
MVRDWRLLIDSVNTEYGVALERARRGEELALVEMVLGNNKLVITGMFQYGFCQRYWGCARLLLSSRQSSNGLVAQIVNRQLGRILHGLRATFGAPT